MKKSKIRTSKRNLKSQRRGMKKALRPIVDREPWGLPYKMVMGMLTQTSPIPGLNLPGSSIVSGLLPNHPLHHVRY